MDSNQNYKSTPQGSQLDPYPIMRFVKKRKRGKPNSLSKRAVIVDLDGTLAHKCNRDIYDLSRVIEDSVDREVSDIIGGLSLAGYVIIVLSGRSNLSRIETTKWLSIKTKFRYEVLHMRENFDNRSDEIVKKEIYEKRIKPFYNIKLVIDDRPKVCRMWREIGLKTLQCGDPHVEF